MQNVVTVNIRRLELRIGQDVRDMGSDFFAIGSDSTMILTRSEWRGGKLGRLFGGKILWNALLDKNLAPDFVEDRGHTFGSDLPDSDKRALIEFMKTF
jgi:hypothetical protein